MEHQTQRTRRRAARLASVSWRILLGSMVLSAMFLAAATVRAQLGDAPPTGVDGQIESGEPRTTPVAAEDPIPMQNLWEIIRSGGVLMIPLAACSLILLAFVFERAISLRRGRVIPRPFVRRFLSQMRSGELDRDEALALCEESGSPVSDVFGAAVRKWARPAVEVEQAIIDAGERVTNSLRRYFRVLNAIATISPLLGLLGTVLGMIRAFNAIATSDAMGRPELLATGISQALLTTAAGMSIAIPALIFYLFFTSRVDRLIMDIDEMGQQLVPLLCAEEIGAQPKPPAASKTSPAPKTKTKTKRSAA